MHARPRLVATDLDGTIIRADGTVSDRTVAALDLVRRAGAEFVLVTGRPPRWLSAIADRIGHRGLAICANGALVYDLAAEAVVEQHALEATTVSELVSRLRNAIPDVSFAVEDEAGMRHEAAFEPHVEVTRDVVRLLDAADLASRPVAKLLVRDATGDPDALLSRAVEIAGGLAELTHSSSTAMIEISATGVTKASTLAALCAERGIPAESVLAFGDMPNDLPLLAWAGTAYAVANAHPRVLEAVSLHTASVEDDGVAQVLERIFQAS